MATAIEWTAIEFYFIHAYSCTLLLNIPLAVDCGVLAIPPIIDGNSNVLDDSRRVCVTLVHIEALSEAVYYFDGLIAPSLLILYLAFLLQVQSLN